MSRVTDYLKKSWPYIAGIGGALGMAMAFYIPGVQDQFDRLESRKIISRYEQLGDEFMAEEQYRMAEEAYARAYELSDEKKLELEVKRLTAKINRVNVEIEWGAELPEDLKEIDFQFLIHFLKGKEHEKDRVSAMNCYGVFLAHSGRTKEAETLFTGILAKHPGEAITLINLGNLYDHTTRPREAEESYRKAITAEPDNGWAHYYLGHLLKNQNRLPEAQKELEIVVKLDPADSEAVHDYHAVIKQLDPNTNK